MKHYLQVYFECVRTCFSEVTSFRVHFVLCMVMDIVFYATSFASAIFIFDHVEVIGEWNKNQFLFFVAFMLAIDQIHMTFVSENFWRFSEDVRTGHLDYTLLKPLGAVFTCFFRRMRPSTLFNFIFVWGALIHFGILNNLSVISWFLLPFAILVSLYLLVMVEILLVISSFWIVEGYGINFLRMQFQQLSRWPDFIYKFYLRKVFTLVVPILVVGSAPVKFLFDQNKIGIFALLFLFAVLYTFLVKVFWKFGLKHYSSASS